MGMGGRSLENLWPVVRVVRVDSGRRAPQFATGPRALPSLLFEVADGGTWRIEDGSGRVVRAAPGCGFVVGPEQRHNLIYEGPRPSQTHFWLLTFRDQLGRELLTGLGPTRVLSRIETRWMRKALGEAMREPARVAGLVVAQRVCLEIISLILGKSGGKLAMPSAVDARIEAALRHIEEHLGERLPRRVLAAQAHLSPTRFHYVFKEAMGRAPQSYVMHRRLAFARGMLVGTGLSVKEIAAASGYADAARFSAAFRRIVGQSPSEYRARFGKSAELPSAPPK